MPETLLTRLREGGKRALADALARIEAAPTAPATIDLLDLAYHEPTGHVIGITGPPGVGKSTLIAGLIKGFRQRGETVGVIAIDPSSRRSGGALLGDRVRIDADPSDQGVFIRSMAARDRLGGLAAITASAVVLMRAVFDRVIVETVGVGQSETDIASVADSIILCVQPGSGDSLQYMKAGIAEIPDIALVTKADLGDVAIRTRRDIRSALTTTGKATGRPAEAGWQVPVLAIASSDEEDAAELIVTLDRHRRHLDAGPLVRRREAQADAWLENAIRESYGREGLKRVQPLADSDPGTSPFRRLQTLERILAAEFSGSDAH
ncbi:MAG: methylmalonyl Co-A mutase-associated GTPase MeaB [Alphaproteobacteria bacterium]